MSDYKGKKRKRSKSELNDDEVKKWKGRHFLITQNDVSLSKRTVKYLKEMKTFRFMVGCREVAPKTHHIHDHFYVQYKDSIRITNKGCEYAHIDKPFGTPEDNIAYIYKLKQPWLRGFVYLKYGEPIFFHGLKVKDVKTMSNEDLDELPLGLYKAAKQVKNDFGNVVKASEIFKETKIFYLWGKTHTLKSKHAVLFIEKCCGDECELVNYANGYWNGMSGMCKTAFYDEFRDTAMPLNIFLQFIDYNIQVLNIKGDHIRNTYERIVITSSQDPALIYSDSTGPNERSGQWLRRMNIFHFDYDEELGEYYHTQENYLFDIKERPGEQISKSRGVVYKHLNGELLNDDEVERYKATHPEEPFPIYDESKIIKLEDDKKMKDKVIIRKGKKMLNFSQAELRLKVYNELKKPLDILPSTNEDILALATPAINEDEDEIDN